MKLKPEQVQRYVELRMRGGLSNADIIRMLNHG